MLMTLIFFFSYPCHGGAIFWHYKRYIQKWHASYEPKGADKRICSGVDLSVPSGWFSTSGNTYYSCCTGDTSKYKWDSVKEKHFEECDLRWFQLQKSTIWHTANWETIGLGLFHSAVLKVMLNCSGQILLKWTSC